MLTQGGKILRLRFVVGQDSFKKRFRAKEKRAGGYSRSLLSLLRELILEPALQFGLVRMQFDCVDFIHELPQLVCWDVVPHRFINPAENLVCGGRPDDSPRFTGSERGSRPVKVERRRQKRLREPASDGGLLKDGDLEWVGCLLP